MASRRRPRTKVYDCNFNLGQSCYQPMLDRLDHKYSGRPLDSVTPAADREETPSSRFSKLLADSRDREGTPSSRAAKLFSDHETNGVDHKSSRRSVLEDDEIDAEFEETMKRIKASRAARNRELEEEFDSFAAKKKINVSDHLLDSVGINSKTQRAIEDDVFSKVKSSAKKFFEEEDDKALTKWTAVRPAARALQEAEEAADEMSATARARQSRARLQDIDAELEDLERRNAARQKRIADLKTLMEAEGSESQSQQNTVKVSKRVTVKSSSEKKQVSF